MSDFCIVGSGPSAISAAVALTRRNLRVTMLDAGRSLEPSRVEIVRRMGKQKPEEWSEADRRALRDGVEASSSGVTLKRSFGSDFPFDLSASGIDWSLGKVGVRPSYARGGLSTVWGAGMLPFHPSDLAGWPAGAANLDEGYKQVLSFVPLSAAHDALERQFPLHTTNVLDLPPSAQGAAFLRDAAGDANGLAVGRSRLAVSGSGCRRCGFCLYGCPYGLIWNSAMMLDRLREHPGFRYESGFVLDRLREENQRVHLEGHHAETHARLTFSADRVFLAAGALSSTAIVLTSLGEFGQTIRLADSFYFLLPVMRFTGKANLEREQLHTLVQAFLVLRDPAVADTCVHFSLYGFNDLMIPSLRASAGAIGGSTWVSSRALVAGGYLHSDLSPGVLMTVEQGRVVLEGENRASAISVAKKAALKLSAQAMRLRALPLTFAMRFPEPGRGFHTGASFPMRAVRTPHTSDIEGRPFGFDRVHLVDASCLPSIPATTVTLPVMANAWRIANLAADRA